MAKVEITDDIRTEHLYIAQHGKIEFIRRLRYVRTSGAAKDVALFLVDCANSDTGKCYPSISDIMKGTGLAEGTVKDAIAALKKVGLIYAKKPWKGAQPDYFLAFAKPSNRMEIHLSNRMEIQPIISDGNPANTIMEHNHGTTTMEHISIGAGHPDAFGGPSDSSNPSDSQRVAGSSNSRAVHIDRDEKKEEAMNLYRAIKDGDAESIITMIESECGTASDNWKSYIRKNIHDGTFDIEIFERSKREIYADNRRAAA